MAGGCALFKYATAETAKIVLESRTRRWSSPSLFNDPFDVQFDLHVEFENAKIADLIADELWEIYSGSKEIEPANDFGRMFKLFSQRVPGLSQEKLFKEQKLDKSIREAIQNTDELLPMLQSHQRMLLKDAKFFVCRRSMTIF